MNTKDFKTRSETIHRAAPCPANHWIIGLDIGYSAIKGMSPNKIYSVSEGSLSLTRSAGIFLA